MGRVDNRLVSTAWREMGVSGGAQAAWQRRADTATWPGCLAMIGLPQPEQSVKGSAAAEELVSRAGKAVGFGKAGRDDDV